MYAGLGFSTNYLWARQRSKNTSLLVHHLIHDKFGLENSVRNALNKFTTRTGIIADDNRSITDGCWNHQNNIRMLLLRQDDRYLELKERKSTTLTVRVETTNSAQNSEESRTDVRILTKDTLVGDIRNSTI